MLSSAGGPRRWAWPEALVAVGGVAAASAAATAATASRPRAPRRTAKEKKLSADSRQRWRVMTADALSGAVAEAACVLALYPFDTMKARSSRYICQSFIKHSTTSFEARRAFLSWALTQVREQAVATRAPPPPGLSRIGRLGSGAGVRIALRRVAGMYAGASGAVAGAAAFGALYLR